jgi:hypothetical protein
MKGFWEQPVLKLVCWIAVGCIVVSSLAALGFLAFAHVANVRGPAGGVGVMAAFFGSGVAFWCSIRSRDSRLFSVALLSVLPLAFWCWAILHSVHE